jgi:hypothetical protein
MRMRAFLAAFALIAGVGALTLADAQAPKSGRAPAKKAAPPVVAPAPVPVGPPAFSVPAGAEPLTFAVQFYAAFHNDFSDLRGRTLRNAAELDAALDKVAGHNRYNLTRGMLAYGALTAAQSEGFVKTVREAAAFYGRDAFVKGLMFDNGYARTLRGAPEAERLALAALRADGDRVVRIGDDYRVTASAVQRDRWGAMVAPRMTQRAGALRVLGDSLTVRAATADQAAKLAPAPASLTPAVDPNVFGGFAFWDTLRTPSATGAVTGGAVQTAMTAGPPAPFAVPEDRTLAVNQMMTLAALYALDATKDANLPIADLLTEQRTVNCFEMVQLQLRQCASAARFHYETAFCLAEQGMQNMGKCIREGRLN